jgi:hypothetical protein
MANVGGLCEPSEFCFQAHQILSPGIVQTVGVAAKSVSYDHGTSGRKRTQLSISLYPRMAGNENGRRLSLVMASGALAGGDQDRCSNQILRSISALRYARQPKIAPVMNKMG